MRVRANRCRSRGDAERMPRPVRLEGRTHAILESGRRPRVRELGRAARLRGAEAEPAERGHDVSILLLRGRASTRTLALSPHERDAKRPLGLVLVVGAAAKAHALHARPAAARHRVDVIELEQPARRAAATAVADERAPTLVALPDCAADIRRNAALPG